MKKQKRCEAVYGNGGKSWGLFKLPKDGNKYLQCRRKAIVKVNNDYVDSGGEPMIWLCASCDQISATEIPADR